MIKKVIIPVVLILIASIAIDIILQRTIGYVPVELAPIKIIALACIYFISFFSQKLRPLSGFLLILLAVLTINMLTGFIQTTSFWKSAFNTASFAGNFGSSILLKVIGILPILAVLFLIFRSRSEFYLCIGDLKQKASRINWLGIKENQITWGKLAIISGLLISLGTILLTIITVTNVSEIKGLGNWLSYLPLILVLALANSFCEGLIFRSAIMATLKDELPKNQLVLIAALFFGISHYYGAPGGPLGVIMSGLLGWYMCRSMYETKGFVSSWMIHAMQDVVIFSTIFLLGNFAS
jgi:membrane protease YdiL (CAAX protease family)